MKLNIKYTILLTMVLNLCFSPSVFSSIGLEVEPGGDIDLIVVPLARQLALSEVSVARSKLKIMNKSSSDQIFTITILSSHKAPGDALREGYVDIPNTSWIWPEMKEVEIEAGGTQEVDIYIKIPKKKEYYNKKYQAIIFTMTKPPERNDATIGILVGSFKRIFISTYASEKEEKESRYPKNIFIIKTNDKLTENSCFLSGLRQFFPYSKIKELDYYSREAEKLIEKLDFIPAYFFSKDLVKNKKFYSSNKVNLNKKGKYYLWSSLGQNGIFIKRPPMAHKLDVFYASLDPFSRTVVDSIISAQKEGFLPLELEINFHYLASAVKLPLGKTTEQLNSQILETINKEKNEDIRMLCVKKYYPGVFFDYLLSQIRDIKSSDWKKLALEKEIDIAKIDSCVLNEGEGLLEEDIEMSEALNIKFSPVFLFENRLIIFDPYMLKELPGFEKFEIKECKECAS